MIEPVNEPNLPVNPIEQRLGTRRRDKLTVEQKKWLAYRPFQDSDKGTCELTRVPEATLNWWKAHHDAFQREYDAIYDLTPEHRQMVSNYLAAISTKALNVLDQLLNHADPKIRIRAVELSMKSQGMLRDVKEITSTEVPFEVIVAAERLKRGLGGVTPEMQALLAKYPQLQPEIQTLPALPQPRIAD